MDTKNTSALTAEKKTASDNLDKINIIYELRTVCHNPLQYLALDNSSSLFQLFEKVPIFLQIE